MHCSIFSSLGKEAILAMNKQILATNEQKDIDVTQLLEIHSELTDEQKIAMKQALSDEEYAASIDDDNITSYSFFGFDDEARITLEETQEQDNDQKSFILTKRQKKLKEAIAIIQDVSANDAKTIVYYPPYLSKTTLPFRKTEEMTFKRTNGSIEMSIVAHPDYGLPYGIIARRLLVYLVSYAIKHKTNVIPIVSIRDLTRELGMIVGGRNNLQIYDMLKRLAGSTLFITGNDREGEELNINRCGIIETVSINKSPKLNSGNHVILDPKFYELSCISASPIDNRVTDQLTAPLEFDLYVFLLARLVSVKTLTRIKWEDFIGQFGSSNKTVKSAKQEIKAAIEHVKIIQPKMNVSYDNDIVMLKPSVSAIKTRKGKYATRVKVKS